MSRQVLEVDGRQLTQLEVDQAANQLLRRYEPGECLEDDGDTYPLAWQRSLSGLPRIPDLVRYLAGDRCVRCQHPYTCGETPGEWSPCDDRCTHSDPIRIVSGTGRQLWRREDVPIAEVRALLEVEPYAEFDPVLEAQWRVLTVHHLTGEKRDCRWWNLAALCQVCHLQIQSKVKMPQVWPHEHSDWFKPHAAGYYAHAYLGEDITYREAFDRQDELLALERIDDPELQETP